jgi:glycosyltransferase involved in cell wall biosynthesis
MIMRLGFDITPLSVPRSGVGTYTAALLEHLAQGNDTIVPLSHFPGHYRWSNNGHLRPKVVNKTVWMQFFLRRQLKDLDLDVCHFTNSVAPLWSSCPSLVTIHDMTLWLFPSYHPRRRLAAMRPIIPFAARQARGIITVSYSTKEDIIDLLGVAPEKVTVLYEAPGKAFRPLTAVQELEIARRQFNLPERFLLHVGTLEPRKNLVRLLEAFASLRHRREFSHDLVLIGKAGWQYREIFSAVERLELSHFVHFLGYVPDRWLATIYNLADALVFPSLYEGFGLPVVEAMACGTPVISSPNGALREIAGEAAAYISPENVESIATEIYRVAGDDMLQAELSARGLARAALFSWRRTAEQTRRLYHHVAAGSQDVASASMPQLRPYERLPEL